ncbi:MAG: hypothetical protein J5908_13130 [Selenomonas sp.]|nr:hypothetical protein [Selenomonas sp.]
MEDRIAVLGNKSELTSFSYAGKVIRFRTSRHLQCYTKIVDWDNGYLVVMARYDNLSGEEEEYIDLIPILQNLYMDPYKFLHGIERVCIDNA